MRVMRVEHIHTVPLIVESYVDHQVEPQHETQLFETPTTQCITQNMIGYNNLIINQNSKYNHLTNHF